MKHGDPGAPQAVRIPAPNPDASARFLRHSGARVPLLCGAMYPCSNPELVAAASRAGALGVVQPLSLTYVHGRELRAGLREIRELSGGAPVGFNALVEKSVAAYERRMRRWVDVALEEGVRFFVTALGDPRWVCEAVHAAGGAVYHDVTERRFAEKACAAGVDGLICVNRRAGGHAGRRSPEELLAELADLGLPLVSAGGVGDAAGFRAALDLGFAAVQMGTRFLATEECSVPEAYRQAILDADEDDIVLTERLSGVPVAVIDGPGVRRLGTHAGPFARWMLRGRRSKHWMRTLYALRSLHGLKRSLRGSSCAGRARGYDDIWQAGRSVGAIHEILPAAEVVHRCETAWRAT